MFENKIDPDIIYPDNSEISNYVVTIFGKRIILKRQMIIIINGSYYIFLGVFNDESKVPNVSCIYSYRGDIKLRTVKRSHIPKGNNTTPIEIPEDHLNGDDSLLRLNINDDDDELMVLMKSLLIQKKVTVGQFKKLYGEDKKDINNDKSRIENKNTLSWNKFRHLLSLLGHEYEIIIYENEK
jgi:hypothetical protein